MLAFSLPGKETAPAVFAETVDSLTPMISACGFPIYVAPLSAGSILGSCLISAAL
jgi:formate-dependent phosphoribosylglycinamide formyltransferase (GAR transformylase)